MLRLLHNKYNYTPESREAEYELLPAGTELGVGNSIWSPLGEGLLTGKSLEIKKANLVHDKEMDGLNLTLKS